MVANARQFNIQYVPSLNPPHIPKLDAVVFYLRRNGGLERVNDPGTFPYSLKQWDRTLCLRSFGAQSSVCGFIRHYGVMSEWWTKVHYSKISTSRRSRHLLWIVLPVNLTHPRVTCEIAGIRVVWNHSCVYDRLSQLTITETLASVSACWRFQVTIVEGLTHCGYLPSRWVQVTEASKKDVSQATSQRASQQASFPLMLSVPSSCPDFSQ